MANRVNGKGESPAYKTEEMLKNEARARFAEEVRLQRELPQKTESQKKAENYWYHYKWHTLTGALCLLMLIVFVKDILFREKPDMTVIVATSKVSISEQEMAVLETSLSGIAEDIDGDGKTLVTLNTIFLPNVPMPKSFSGNDAPDARNSPNAQNSTDVTSMADPQMEQASLMKLMAVVAEGSNSLYLIDDDFYTYFSIMSSPAEYNEDGRLVISGKEALYGDIIGKYSLFQALDFLPSPSFYSLKSGAPRDRVAVADTKLSDTTGLERLTDLTFCLRTLTDVSDEKRVAEHESIKNLLANLVD